MNFADRASRASNTVEHRDYHLRDIEFRDDGEESSSVIFEGVASVVNQPYTVRDQLGEFTETIAAGAFNKTLRDSKADVALYVNHRWDDVPLATRGAGTLTLEANPDLAVGANLDAVRSDVVIVRSALRRREMRQMSIGFTVPKGKDTWNDDYTERTIHELKLVEVSIVKDGANHLTSASVRNRSEHLRRVFAKRAAPMGGMSFGDVMCMVCDAICDRIEEATGIDPGWDLWLDDAGPDWAVYSVGGDYWQVPYSIDAAGEVTLGDAFEVNRQTLYTPVAQENAAGDFAEEIRLWQDAAALLRTA